MQLLNYLLLICFINFCNSFTLINKKYILSQDCKHKLNMGCDYYIDNNDINDNNDNNDSIISYINLYNEHDYCWVGSLLDVDEDGYDQNLTQYIKDTLDPNIKPIIISSNNTFK